MIKNRARWQEWESDYLKRTPQDIQRNFEILDAMYEHARALGAFAQPASLDGLDVKIKMARVLNVPITPRSNRKDT